jgi:hypothetical protein
MAEPVMSHLQFEALKEMVYAATSYAMHPSTDSNARLTSAEMEARRALCGEPILHVPKETLDKFARRQTPVELPVPMNVGEAKLMALVGMNWLQEHAPKELKEICWNEAQIRSALGYILSNTTILVPTVIEDVENRVIENLQDMHGWSPESPGQPGEKHEDKPVPGDSSHDSFNDPIAQALKNLRRGHKS